MCLSVIVGMVVFVAQPEFVGPILGVRCGRIIIVGNTDTPDRVILKHLPFGPGQKVELGSIQRVRRSLQRCPTLQYNPRLGIGPVVELRPTEFESEFWDVRIQVVDRPGTWLWYSVTDLLRASVLAANFRDPTALGTVRRELEYIVDRIRRESNQRP